jgi:hypothetical protein
MDLEQIIRELRERLKYLDWVIAALEQLEMASPLQPMVAKSGIKRRGRRFMGPEERRQVSERMKRYWSARKQAKDKDRKPKASQPSVL